MRDVVEFTKILQPDDQNDDALHDQVSPDGNYAFIVIRKADIDSDTNRYRIQLLDVRPDRLAAQTVPSPVTVFSLNARDDFTYDDAAVQQVKWHGNRTLLFLARLDGPLPQVYSLDVVMRKLVRLTSEKNLIVSYDASQDLGRIVYSVIVPNPPQRKGAHDVVVGSQSFWSVKFGQDDVKAQQRKYQYFVVDAGSGRAPRALGASFPERNGANPTVSMSPDGQWALLPRYEPDRTSTWEGLYPLVAEFSTKLSLGKKMDPLGYFLDAITYVPRRMTAWHLDDGKEQTVVDAPDDAAPNASQFRPDRLWQTATGSVVLAGTMLPAGADGKTSPASHVIEYWPGSGRWADIATLNGRTAGAYATRTGFLVIDGDKHREFQRLPNGAWQESAGETSRNDATAASWSLRTIQGLNLPPDVYAFGPSGEKKPMTRLNPQYDPNAWGTMKPYSWRTAQGREWNGGLMHAAGMDEHGRYPLLIQTYGFDANRFYLDGPFDGASSAFAGRAFLRHGILVLAVPYRASNDTSQDWDPKTFEDFNDGVRSAVEALVKEGRVDPTKVGIIGWSATGERVLRLLTFGDVPLRAATMADANANTLFSYTITYGRMDTTWARKEGSNEGPPFGDGLAGWVRNDSSLHTDCIRAPLRIESYGPNVGNNWDLYALLRRQYKPAEMIVIPTGAHSLGAPGDRMASLQGNVDWFGFWLAGQTRTEPLWAAETQASVASQYARWQQMQTLHKADEARPPCAR